MIQKTLALGLLITGLPLASAQAQDLNSLIQQAHAVIQLDDKCAAMGLDARLVTENILMKVSVEAYSQGGEKKQQAYRDVLKKIDAALVPILTGTCTELAQKKNLINLVKGWNDEGMMQMAVWDKLPADACKVEGPEHARLRTAARGAYEKLSSLPESQWRPLFNKRLAFHTKRCNSVGRTPDRSAINESIVALKLDYKEIQALGPEVEAAQKSYYGLWGVRGANLDYVAVKHKPQSSVPHTLKMQADKSLVIEFDHSGVTSVSAVMKINDTNFPVTQETANRFVMSSQQVEKFLRDTGEYAKIDLTVSRRGEESYIGELKADNLRKAHRYGAASAFK